MHYPYVIVGAGIAGITVAERLAQKYDQPILLVEKRNHIGGNIYDCYNEAGILIHQYGPHIFHTNHKHVYDYLSQFTEWNDFQHRVLIACGRQFIADADFVRDIESTLSFEFVSGRNGGFYRTALCED